jgi:hypothetical protein
MWLVTLLPAYQAALCVAGGLIFVGGLVILVACIRHRRSAGRVKSTVAGDINRQAEAAAHSAVKAVLSEVEKSPTSAMLTVLALGVVVGLLCTKDDP